MASKKSAAAKPAEGTKGAKTSKTAVSKAKEKSLNELTSALAEKTGTTKVQAKAFLGAHAEFLIVPYRSNSSQLCCEI